VLPSTISLTISEIHYASTQSGEYHGFPYLEAKKGHLTEKQRLQDDSYSFPYHYLDLVVDEYRLIHRVLGASRINTVKNLLRPFRGQRILDAGCGDGRFCYELKSENVRLIGVDLSERALAFARAFNPEVEFYRQDLKNFPPPYQFDSIVMMETLEHVIPGEIPLVLEHLANVLHPDGQLIITVPSVTQAVDAKHYQHFSEESLSRTLKDYFKITHCIGHIRRYGFRIKLFWRLRKRSELLYSFRKDFRGIYRLYEYLNRYFETHVAVGKPEECMTIIAVCEKV